MSRAPLYIETTIRCSLDQLWEKSQDPVLHQRWDLRFSEIDYLPRGEGELQRFVYGSRVAGLRVYGTGESTGQRYRQDGASSSSLRFWSDHPLALIRQGSGYWRYMPTSDGVRFYTGYDYEVRWGWFGRFLDMALFRPWMGWATAWSFDRLRLWLERGIQPESTLALSVAHLVARIGLGLMWVYQGLVPKLLAPEGEVALVAEAGIPNPELAVTVLGLAEALFGLVFLFLPRWRWPFLTTLFIMVALGVGAVSTGVESFTRPFNPFSLNFVAGALGVVGHVTWADRPSASRCLRKPPRETDVDLYRRALGKEFDRLHPMIQERFGFDSSDGVASIGHGVMDQMWRGPWWTIPFLWIGERRSIMFPNVGSNIPFSVHNYAYKDSFGRETITWVRVFEFPEGQRRFDATMIYAESRGRIVDYIGNHQHLAVDMECSVDETTRGIRFRSREQRFYEGKVAFRFPRLLTGDADVMEWYHEDSAEYRITVEVRNPMLGLLFGYRGRFIPGFEPVTEGDIPPMVKPQREEARE